MNFINITTDISTEHVKDEGFDLDSVRKARASF